MQSDSGMLSISSLMIFDRSGNVVYDGKGLSISEGWDGTINGKKVATGVYTYLAVVLMDDDKERSMSGTFSLID